MPDNIHERSNILAERLRSSWLNLFESRDTDIELNHKIFKTLVNSYSNPTRNYHNLEHIKEVLELIKAVKGQAKNINALCFAAWFHDCIYNPQASDNEAKSAVYAVECLKQLKINALTIKTVNQIILSTKKHQPLIQDIDNLLFLDIDLAILGANPHKYHEYARSIRQEYSYLSDRDYQQGRKKVLAQFLARTQIYFTDYFYRRLESIAKENIQQEINWLDCNL